VFEAADTVGRRFRVAQDVGEPSGASARPPAFQTNLELSLENIWPVFDKMALRNRCIIYDNSL
jgi:hypothetical protein